MNLEGILFLLLIASLGTIVIQRFIIRDLSFWRDHWKIQHDHNEDLINKFNIKKHI